ncbi:hypothetical protein CATRI_04910 [Corynebacterium atrinae]|uniref:hypothetical protein n=1 Tax=Corynebacterium atrinae TaxID=1336740 RepID=UPI0025B42D1F|nr:hypothetical protein [Corynebacterium atrinae]WJY63075.1 hypothetical protein CATRI_04910 [Corynebacterium atrinae]
MIRIHGLDLARALAIIGMIAAHLGPETWITTGYPSVLFAVLAGVSMGIITERSESLSRARFNILIRAVILLGLGVLLSGIQSYIMIVLTAIGAAYLLLLPVIGWRIRWLFTLLAVLLIVGPLLAASQYFFYIGFSSMQLSDLLFGSYPLLAWVAYLLIGLLIHRLALARADRQWMMLGIGGILLFVTWMISVAVIVSGGLLTEFLGDVPHSGGFLDVVGSSAMSMVVIAVCLLASRVPAIVWMTYPLRALGAMSYTVYIVHVLITTIANGTFVSAHFFPTEPPYYDPDIDPDPKLGDEWAWDGAYGSDFEWSMYPPGEGTYPMPIESDPAWMGMFLAQVLGFLLFASLWRWFFRRGPVEWAVHRVVQKTMGSADTALRTRTRRSTLP